MKRLNGAWTSAHGRGAAFGLLAALLLLVVGLGSGCACSRGGKTAAAAEPAVALPEDELCRIRPMRSDKRYVSLITGECASSEDSVGLKSSESKDALQKMGAHE